MSRPGVSQTFGLNLVASLALCGGALGQLSNEVAQPEAMPDCRARLRLGAKIVRLARQAVSVRGSLADTATR